MGEAFRGVGSRPDFGSLFGLFWCLLGSLGDHFGFFGDLRERRFERPLLKGFVPILVALGGHLGIHFEKNSDRFETERTAIANLYGNGRKQSRTVRTSSHVGCQSLSNDKAYD